MDHDQSMECLNEVSAVIDEDISRLEYLMLDKTLALNPIRTEHYCRSQAHRRVTELHQKAVKASESGKTCLGHVYSASGYRQEGERWPFRLDWALIEVEESRAAANKVRLKKHSLTSRTNKDQGQIPLCDKANFPVDKNLTDLCPGYQRDSLLGDHMYKFGRTTKGTEGLHGIFAAFYHLPDVEYDGEYPVSLATYEQEILMPDCSGEPFAQAGDAGSLVFTAEAEFAGLGFGGNTVARATYYTPRETVFKDILRITGAKKIRMPLEPYVGVRQESCSL